MGLSMVTSMAGMFNRTLVFNQPLAAQAVKIMLKSFASIAVIVDSNSATHRTGLPVGTVATHCGNCSNDGKIWEVMVPLGV
jgi:hypothetical protein